MQDQHTHGLIQSVPPQTHCGFSTFGRKATTDPLRVTCPPCKRIMGITEEMPNFSGAVKKNLGGRPKKKRS
jgi:hypothetical protein